MTLPTVDRTDGSYRVAVGDEDILVPGEYTAIPTDAVYAPCEDAIKALFRAATAVTVGDSEIRVRVASPERALVEHDVADDETEAVARLAVLDHEDIVALEDDPDASGENVVLAVDEAEAIGSNEAAVYNWTAIVETTSRLLDDRLARVREMEHSLLRRLTTPQSDRSIGVDIDPPQERIEEIHRRIQSLGDHDTDEVPDPKELSRDDQMEYNHLQRASRIARARLRFTRGRTPDPTRVDPDEVLREGLRNYEDLVVGFEQFHLEIRSRLALDTWSHGGITDFLYGFGDVLESLARLDQSLEERSHEEFVSEMDSITDGSAAMIEPIRRLRDTHDPAERERVRQRIEDRREDNDGFEWSPFDPTN